MPEIRAYPDSPAPASRLHPDSKGYAASAGTDDGNAASAARKAPRIRPDEARGATQSEAIRPGLHRRSTVAWARAVTPQGRDALHRPALFRGNAERFSPRAARRAREPRRTIRRCRPRRPLPIRLRPAGQQQLPQEHPQSASQSEQTSSSSSSHHLQHHIQRHPFPHDLPPPFFRSQQISRMMMRIWGRPIRKAEPQNSAMEVMYQLSASPNIDSVLGQVCVVHGMSRGSVSPPGCEPRRSPSLTGLRMTPPGCFAVAPTGSPCRATSPYIKESARRR